MKQIKVMSLGTTEIVIEHSQTTGVEEKQMTITLDNELILFIADEIRSKIKEQIK